MPLITSAAVPKTADVMDAPEGVFSCPKFLDALSILNRYYQMDEPHLQHDPATYDMWKKQQQANLQAEELSPVVAPSAPRWRCPHATFGFLRSENFVFANHARIRYTLPAGSKPKLLEPVQMIEGDNVRPNGQPGQRFLPIVYCRTRLPSWSSRRS